MGFLCGSVVTVLHLVRRDEKYWGT